jgi:hypothetical protein
MVDQGSEGKGDTVKMSKVTNKKRAPRLRLATDIDMSKAKKSCKGCYGTGRKGWRTIDNPEDPGKKVKVPVICKCVTRNGGVKKDMLDELAEEMVTQMEEGVFAETLARDIMGLPIVERVKAIEQLERDLDNPDKLEVAKEQTREALAIIKQKMKEETHGDA